MDWYLLYRIAIFLSEEKDLGVEAPVIELLFSENFLSDQATEPFEPTGYIRYVLCKYHVG